MDAGGVKRVLQQFLSTPEPLQRVQLPPVLFPGMLGKFYQEEKKNENILDF